jgi:hypothetical protein
MFGRQATPRLSRGATWVLTLALLAGQVGVPSCPARPAGDEQDGCQCALWARALGRCCCRTQNAPAKRSCCSQAAKPVRSCCSRVASKPAAKPASTPRPGLHKACPCDQPESVALLRCHDPRVMVVPPQFPPREISPERCPLDSDSAAGIRPRPDVPPPRTPMHSAIFV